MPQVFFGGDNEFNALVFGEQHPGTLQHLQMQLAQPTEHLSASAQQFVAQAWDLYEQFNGLEAQRAAQAAIRKVKGIFQPNSVQALYELADLQQAQPVMQRFIMACPEIRRAYFDQRIDGYADSYVDMHPGRIGEDHYDYRRVVEGVYRPVEGNPEYDWEHTEWIGDLHPDDRELSLEEQLAVMSTWDVLTKYLSVGKDDPTSPVGGKL